jgi:hypothetical protein
MPTPPQQSPQSGSVLLTIGQNIVTALNGIAQLLSMSVLPQVAGNFTMAAAATLTIAQPSVSAGSKIFLQPTNAAAGTLQGSAKCLYISAINSGVGFTVATASAGNAVGTETFNYVVL